MTKNRLRLHPAIVAAALAGAALFTAEREAAAEELIIKQPGQHPDYAVEIEPEGIVSFGTPLDQGPGIGLRASIPFMHNGFISSLNNSPGISFGLSRTPIGDSNAPFYAPVVFQWNFWLSTHWSVMGEAGAFLIFGDGATTHLDPTVMAGGRYHITPGVAITARISVSAFSSIGIGVSFFL